MTQNMLPHLWSENVPPPSSLLLLPGQGGVDQLQMVERLKQLRAWQVQQQESLLRRQQEQLAKLRSEQGALRVEVGEATTGGAGLTTPLTDCNSFQGLAATPLKAIENTSQPSPRRATQEAASPSSPHARWDKATVKTVDTEDGGDKDAVLLAPAAGTPFHHHSEGRREGQLPDRREAAAHDERPIKPGIGLQSGMSFEELVENQLSQSALLPPASLHRPRTTFLKKGQGIARFGMKRFRIGTKRRKRAPGVKQGWEAVSELHAPKPDTVPHPPALSRLPPTSGETPPPSHYQRVLAGSQYISRGQEELSGSNESIPQAPFRVSTPTMRRCSSEDSFLLRKDHRLQLEEKELREFELLEQAAEDSFSSQSSLLAQPLGSSSTSALLPRTDSPLGLRSDPSQPTDSIRPEAETPPSSRGSSEGPETDLDETLKPSLAADMQFSDEDPWESFAQSSPQAHRAPSSPSPSRGRPAPRPSWASPVKRELLDQWGRTVSASPLPAPSLSCQPPVASHSLTEVETATHHPALAPPHTSIPVPPLAQDEPPHLSHLPPPSALVSKLFPALRKEKDDSRRQAIEGVVGPPSNSPLQSLSSTSTEGSGRGTEDSGRGSVVSSAMSEELCQKLCQLETEIERFRSENAALAHLRDKKEHELSYLKQEVAEFERQKREEVERFEEYKREEIKKLKKERKVFESYQREARTARDKRDKEEIEMLRNELQELREELQRRESRWSASLSRCRLKAEGLEARNRELQEDLRIIEQERLQLWQTQLQQVETKNRKPLARENSGTRCGTDRQGPVTKSSGKSTTASREKSTEVTRALKEPSKGVPVNEKPFEREGNREGAALSVQGECEIVEIICRGKDEEEGGGPEGEGGSDLSAIAEEIVGAVLGGGQMERKRENTQQAKVDTEAGEGGGEGKKAAKSVRFSDSVTAEDDTSPTGTSPAPSGVQKEAALPKDKVESVQEDGTKVTTFPNGTRKIISKDGRTISVHFFNGDIKRIQPNQTILYYYAHSRTTHTTYPDGLEVLEFPNSQCEKHYPNGTKEILFPDGATKYVYVSGEEESVFPDGTVQKLLPSGDRSIEFPTGQREIHTRDFKRREYPDGTVKTVYPDGRQETRYASGRLRIKDKTGYILVDKMEHQNQTT